MRYKKGKTIEQEVAKEIQKNLLSLCEEKE